MRTLAPAPARFRDASTHEPAFGSYEGALPRVDLGGLSLVQRTFRRKKWLYVAITTERVWVSLAVVRMGYATSAFAFVYDIGARRMLVDRTVVAPPRVAEVADDPTAEGLVARFAFGRSRISLVRKGERRELRARFTGLSLDATFDGATAPPAISAVARLGPSLASATEKLALADVKGSVEVDGQRIALDGGFGGYDYTHGLMPRHTRWRWAFAMGEAKDGEPVAFNLVDGFVGEAECAAFRAGRVFPLYEPRIRFDVEHPERPWRLEGEGVDLTFHVGAVHAQRTNLAIVRSRFLQPTGVFHGTLQVDGRSVELEALPGVVENQDVLW